jgi:hypothetical protein
MGHVLCVQGAARQARRETQVCDEVDHRPRRGWGEGAGQAGSHHRVRAVAHGRGLRPLAPRTLLQGRLRHRLRVGQARRRRGGRLRVAAGRGAHGGVPRRLRDRAQREAVAAEDDQGAVVQAGEAEAARGWWWGGQAGAVGVRRFLAVRTRTNGREERSRSFALMNFGCVAPRSS